MDTTFSQLLFRAGFYTAGFLDKKRATRYLKCTIRTLDRWIQNDNPCPRAVMLLQQKQKICPWPDARFDHDHKLILANAPNGFSRADLENFQRFHRDAREMSSDNQMLCSLLEELRDDKNAIITLNKLMNAINQLHEVTREPMFQQLQVRKKMTSMC